MENTPADAAGSGRRTRTRTRGAEASRRAAMLQRLRAVRRGEFRASDAIQVKVDAPIYDTVPEEEYNELVARRRKEAGEFIDDDGLGYVQDGSREDWSQRALRSSSDEGSDGAPRERKQISSMFTSSIFKRPGTGSDRAQSLALAADSIVDDVIAEVAPDENDREERRRRLGRVIANAEMVRSKQWK